MAATPKNFGGAYRPVAQEINAVPLNAAVDKVVGNAATLLTKPEGCSILVLHAETEDFLLKVGNVVSAFPDDAALSTTTTGATAGNACSKVLEGDRISVAAPDLLTVKGESASSVLRYYWV